MFLVIAHQDTGYDLLSGENAFYIVGNSWGKGSGRNDFALTKLDMSTDVLWHNYFGHSHDEYALQGFRCNDGGIVMVGFTKSFEPYGDIYLVKVTPEGEKIWEANFGGEYVDYGFAVTENKNGELLVAGVEGGFFLPTRADFKSRNARIILIKTDSEGKGLWQKVFESEGHEWIKAIVVASGGGYLLCGTTQDGAHGGFDMLLMKIDDDGNEIWRRTYGGKGWDKAEQLTLSTDGYIYMAGSSVVEKGGVDSGILLVKTNPDGGIIWEKRYKTEGKDYASDVIATPDSGCVVAGYSSVGEFGKSDMLLYKLDSDGIAQKITRILPDDDEVVSLSLYPIPVTDNQFFIEIQTWESSKFELHVYDLNGRICHTSEIWSNQKVSVFPELTSGVYVYVIRYVFKCISI
jgi:hypothetical protein